MQRSFVALLSDAAHKVLPSSPLLAAIKIHTSNTLDLPLKLSRCRKSPAITNLFLAATWIETSARAAHQQLCLLLQLEQTPRRVGQTNSTISVILIHCMSPRQGKVCTENMQKWLSTQSVS